MSRSLEFNFKVNGTPQGIKDISEAIKQVGKNVGSTASEIQQFERALNIAQSSGQSLSKALTGLGKNSVVFTELASGLKEFISEQQRAQAETQKLGRLMDQAIAENARRAQKEVQALQNDLRGLTRAIPGGGILGQVLGSGFGVGITAAAIAAGIAATITGVVKLAGVTGEYALAQENLASRTGLTVQETQVLGQAAAVAGVNVSSLTTVMRTLSKGMAENSAEGRQAKQALKELGVDSSVAFEPTGKALETIFSALGKVEKGAERDRIAIALFGRSGLELLPLVDNFKDFTKAIESNGSVMDTQGIQRAADYERKVKLLDQAWQGLKRSFGEKAIGVINLTLGGEPISGDGANISLSGVKNTIASLLANLSNPAIPFVPGGGGPNRADVQRDKEAQVGRDAIKMLTDKRNQEAAQAKQETSDRIQKTLRSGGGRLGQEERIGLDMKNAESDLAAAIDKQDEKAVVTANNKIIALKGQLKALGEYKSLHDELFKKEQQAALQPFGRVGEIEAQRRDTIQKINESSLSKKQKDSLISGFNQSFGKEEAAAAKEQADQQVEKRNEQNEVLRKDSVAQMSSAIERIFGKQELGRSLKDALKEWSEERAQREQQINESRSTAIRNSNQASVLNRLNAGPGSENATIDKTYQDRLALAQQLAEFDTKIANLELDEAKKKLDLDKIGAEQKKEFQEAEFEREKALIELSNKRRDEFASFAQGLVGAARKGQVGSFVKSQGDNLLDQVVGNAAKLLYKPGMLSIPGQSDAQGQPTILGKLLGGTMFGQDKTNNPVITSTDTNTQATNANTQALLAAAGISSSGIGLPGGTGGIDIPSFGAGGGSALDQSLNSGADALSEALGGSTTASSTPSGSGGLLGKILGIGGAAAGGGVLADFFGGLTGGPRDLGGTPGTGDAPGKDLGFSKGGSPLTTLFDSDASGASRAGAAIGAAGAIYGGVEGVIAGVKQGGARGTLGAIGSVAGTAAALDPEPISKAVLAAVALGTKLIGGLLGDPKQERATAIDKELQAAKYTQPDPLKINVDSNGKVTDVDFKGRVRSLNQTPTIDYYNKILGIDPLNPSHLLSAKEGFVAGQNPGIGLSGQPPGSVQVNVTAMDSKSFLDHSGNIANALRKAIQDGHPVRNEIRSKLVNVK